MLSIISSCLVMLGYSSQRKNGAIMAAIMATVTAITKMVRGRMEAVPLDAIVVHPAFNSFQHLVDQIAAFASRLTTTELGGKHRFLPLGLTKTKMRLAAGNQDLDCGRIKMPDILNPKIEEDTKGRKILQLQEENKVNWKEYNFQEVVDAVAVEAIVLAVDAQYTEELKEDYVCYKNQNIQTMVEQLQTWYVITTKEKLAIKAHFLEPWNDTPITYITTLSLQLYRHQVECKDHGATVTKANKVDHFASQMYDCNLFEEKILYD